MKKLALVFTLVIVVSSLAFATAIFAADETPQASTSEVAAAKDAVKKIEAKDVERVKPADIYDKVQTGEVLLVCAYSDAEKFANLHLKGAISLKELDEKLKDMEKAKLIVFYCG